MLMLNFASYAQAIELGMTQPNKRKMTETLFKFITDMDFVRDKNGDPYVIKKDQYSKWCAEKMNITKVLKDAADNSDVVQSAPKYFEDIVIPKLISPQRECTVYDAVKVLITRDSSIDKSVTDELLERYSNDDYGAFLGGAFLYAIICKNDSKKSAQRAANEKAIIELPEVQEYKRFREKFPKPELLPTVVSIKGKVFDAVNAAALSGKLLQMANGAVYGDDRKVFTIHDRKLDALEDLVEAANGKPLLVAYWYKHDLKRIKDRFKTARMIDTSKDITDWNEGKIEIGLIHPASAGHGLNLQEGGSTIVWFGQTWSLELYQQLNARLWRQGQRETVVVHHIVTKGTIDENVMKALGKKDASQAALIDAVRAQIGG
jgi:hypothetical protein